MITYAWREPFTSTEVSALHAAAFGHRDAARNWRDQVERYSRAGCAWLHVDFEEHLRPFYLRGCGFTASPAGIIAL